MTKISLGNSFLFQMTNKSQVYLCPTIRQTILISVVILSVVGCSECGKYEDELFLTAREKEALERFKAKVIPQIPKSSYIQNYIRDDLYFIRWLRARNTNVDLAEQAFLTHLKWRNEENMDTIDEEDWEDFQTQFPIFVDTEDRKGQPIMEALFGDFQIREGVLTGKMKKILRWILRGHELANRRIYKARAAGQEISQLVLLADIQGFNIPQHGCPGCLRIYIMAALGFERHYPNLLDTSFIVNMPPTFEAVLNLVKTFLREETRATINTYGRRKDSWVSVLDLKNFQGPEKFSIRWKYHQGHRDSVTRTNPYNIIALPMVKQLPTTYLSLRLFSFRVHIYFFPEVEFLIIDENIKL